MKEKIVDNEKVAELVERMLKGEVRFKLLHYSPEDIFRQEPCHMEVKGTLEGYEKDFGKPYSHREGCQFVPYWDVEKEEWRTFRCVNLITNEEE